MTTPDLAARIDAACTEMAVVVEALTGWSDLRDRMRFEPVDDLIAALGRYEREAVGDASEPDDDAGAMAGEKGPVAFYDPFREAVYVDRALCEALPADALRGLVGHELVHVGQFRSEGVVDALRAVMRADREAQGTPEALKAREALVRFVSNLEGHARHLEEDHFAKHAAVAPVERLLSPLDVAALAEARRARTRAVVERLEDPSHAGFLREAWLADKEQQYAIGAKAYRARSVSGAPARFDPRLRPSPYVWADQGGDVTALREAAEAGNVAARSELAQRVQRGHGVPVDDAEAVRLLHAAAEGDDAASLYFLGRRYALGQGVARDEQRALSYFERSAEGGFSSALLSYGTLLRHLNPSRAVEAFACVRAAALARDADALAVICDWCFTGVPGVDVDPADTVGFSQLAAALGRPEGMHTLGRCHLTGRGVARDLARARQWFERSAALGFAPSRITLGAMLCHGLGGDADPVTGEVMLEALAREGSAEASWQLYRHRVRSDEAAALAWLARAAEGRVPDALFEHGRLLLRGERGVTRDVDGAVARLTEAAALGHALAMRTLATSYAEGDGVARDLAASRAWMTRAAECGDGWAQFSLGYDLLTGGGGPVDVAGAVRWYERAIAQGAEGAACSLGWALYDGRYTTRDRRKALRWFRKGSAQGDAAAARMAGLMLRDGDGCRRDLREAVMHLTRAATLGDADAAQHLAQLYSDPRSRLRDVAAARRWRAAAARAVTSMG